MTKKLRVTLIIAVLSLVATGLYPSNLSAQITLPQYQFLAAGASSQFNTVAFAALDPNATGNGNTACTGGNGSSHWANTTGMTINDPRGNPNIKAEAGSVWIGWNAAFISLMDYDMAGGGANPPTGATICSYLSLDSVVGMREYFANGTFLLNVNPNTADASNATVPGLPNGTALPPEVLYFFNNAATNAALTPAVTGGLGFQTINVAPTDIRPEDGKFATVRALTTLGAQMPGPPYAGLGYGPGPSGTAIKSNFSSKIMQVADFTIDSRENDPINGHAPRPYTVSTVGAAPVLVIVNNTTSSTGAGHTGYYSQINKQVLANIFSGQTHVVRDIGNGPTSDPVNPLTVFQREPLSGTYNTFDFNVTCAYDRYGSYGGSSYYACQETDVNAQNPLNLTYTISNGSTASRQRVIGTGEMAKGVCGALGSWTTGAPDSIGYIFWGFSNFKGMNTNCKYLPVDNIDPLYLYPTANPGSYVGYIPTCSFTQGAIGCPTLSFPKVVDGGYPIWTMYRWVSDGSGTSYVGGVLPYVELVASSGYLTDFVPIANMRVFHQHYDQCVTTVACDAQYGANGVDATSLLGSTCGSGGNLPCVEAEAGGDMGGKVLTVNSEIDYTADHLKNSATSGCTAANWPDAGDPGICMQTTIDLGNHRLPPW